MMLNFYLCPDDHTKWQSLWDCGCNDRCPECNKEIEAYLSLNTADIEDKFELEETT